MLIQEELEQCRRFRQLQAAASISEAVLAHENQLPSFRGLTEEDAEFRIMQPVNRWRASTRSNYQLVALEYLLRAVISSPDQPYNFILEGRI